MNVNFVRRSRKILAGAIITGSFITGVVGCSGRPSVLPNPEPTLRKSTAEFAADAVKRFPYKADFPRGGEAKGRAQVGYVLDRLEVGNYSGEVWTNLDVWVNGSYVVHVPIIKNNELVRLDFQMLFDDKGHYFPTDNRERKDQISKVEIYRDGKIYDVPLQLAD